MDLFRSISQLEYIQVQEPPRFGDNLAHFRGAILRMHIELHSANTYPASFAVVRTLPIHLEFYQLQIVGLPFRIESTSRSESWHMPLPAAPKMDVHLASAAMPLVQLDISSDPIDVFQVETTQTFCVHWVSENDSPVRLEYVSPFH
jgi:hypothetical protein